MSVHNDFGSYAGIVDEPLGVAGILLGKGFISGEIMSKVLIISYTPTEKAAILIEAVRNKIELAPSKFTELLGVLSEVACAKEVVERLHSTYQSELTSLMFAGANLQGTGACGLIYIFYYGLCCRVL
jgi:hypothetical protein